MKQRKSFIDKLYLQHKKVILIILSIALFVGGYLASVNTLYKPISDSQFEFYEQVACDVYEQGNKAIYEVPDGVSLERTSTSITISSANRTYRGKVIANLQNGELVYTRKPETGFVIFASSLIGAMFVCIGVLVWEPIDEKIKKRN